jgi:hypothetical protein
MCWDNLLNVSTAPQGRPRPETTLYPGHCARRKWNIDFNRQALTALFVEHAGVAEVRQDRQTGRVWTSLWTSAANFREKCLVFLDLLGVPERFGFGRPLSRNESARVQPDGCFPGCLTVLAARRSQQISPLRTCRRADEKTNVESSPAEGLVPRRTKSAL